MKKLLMLCLASSLFAGDMFTDLEPKKPILKKTCSYSKIQKPYGYRTYFIFEDKVSDKVVIFSKSKDKLYTVKSEMQKYNLYDCQKLLPLLNEMQETQENQ